MKKTITLLFTLLGTLTYSQTFNPKTITLPENVTVEDLSFLKNEIKDSQVVMLGEIHHFDGNVFEMKTKVVKYLYQEMSFKTIAFESGVYDVWKAQKAINEGYDTKKAFLKSLFTIWSKKNEFQSFIQFYDANKTDLKLFGFDNQITGIYGETELVDDLYAYCKLNQLKLKLDKEDLSLLLESMSSSSIFDEEDISYNQYKSSLTGLLNSIAAKPQNEDTFYWYQTIKSLLTLGEDYYSQKETILSPFYATADYYIRDKQMADNLLAYIKNHPNEKIICWGASAHFINDMSSVTTPIIKDFIPMGSYIKTVLKEKAYSLSVITASEEFCFDNNCDKTPIDPASFEGYLKKKNSPYLFISSNQPEMKKVQLNRLFSPIDFIESRLDLLHDGYIYLDKPKLSTLIADVDNIDPKKNSSFLNKQVVIISNNKNSTLSSDKEVNNDAVALNEVVIFNKRSTSQIVKKAIDNLHKNYPDIDISSTMFTNIIADIQGTNCLNLDFTANQYENGYFSYFRSVKNLKEIRWNTKDYEPKSWRSFWGLSVNPIKNSAFLDNSKFKKFTFNLDEIKKYNNKDVYVISFSTTRNHSSFTRRVYLSNFSGTVYINKDDYAVVKIIENWEVTKFPEEQSRGFKLSDMYVNYNAMEYTHERIETDFIKIDNLYYLSHSLIDITGNIIDTNNKKSLPFTTRVDTYWSDFNVVNPEKIKFKDEIYLFEEIKYNKEFWDKFKIPR